MKNTLFAAVALVAGFGTMAADSQHINRDSMTAVAKTMDERLSRMFDDNPLALIGLTRGIYLDQFGALFSAEMNLVNAPVSLMHPAMSKDEIAHHRAKKLERLPALRKMMRESLVSSATSLDSLPPDEQVAIVIFVAHYSWEDLNGVPTQIMMQCQRKKLLEAQRSGPAAIEAAIHMTEY